MTRACAPPASRRFTTLTVPAAGDGVPRRVRVHVPDVPAPAGGHAVAYVLDGDAAEHVLATVAPGEPEDVVVVALGYALDAEGVKAARAYDYTPPIAGQADLRDPRMSGWRAGGADRFLDWLDRAVRPAVADHCAVDPARTLLAGHSYGGLCVLRALCRQAPNHAAYLAASPSVWWHERHILQAVTALRERGACAPARVLVMAGERETRHAAALGPDGTPHSRRGGAPTLDDARAVAGLLDAVAGLVVGFESVPGGTHALLAGAAVRRALRLAAEITAPA